MASKTTKALTPSVVERREDKKVSKKALGREEIKQDGYFSIYVNDIRVQTSIWDVRIKMGEVDGDSEDILRIKSFGEVRLSPQLAMKLTLMLIQQLEGYEEKYGTMPRLPD